MSLYHLDRKQSLIDLFIMIYIILQMVHIFACAFNFVGVVSKNRFNQSNWIDRYELTDADFNTRYLYSFYWSAVTTMTVGYGDITPQNNYEVLLVISCILIGCGVYAYFINKIGMILEQLNQKEHRYNN